MANNLLSEKKLLLDSDPVKKYTNIRLKKDLIENEHYMVVSSLLWKYIYNIYGGFEI